MHEYRSERRIRFERALPKLVTLLFILLALFGAYSIWVQQQHRDDGDIIYGATFSTKYAKELGITNWRAAYLASLEDLEIKRYRIPVYWDEIEVENGNINLTDVRWMLDQAAVHDARVTLAIGERVPRWPECHPPEWAKSLSMEERRARELQMIRAVVEEFKSNTAVRAWQVQNEPFLKSFGLCPDPSEQHVRDSIALVKSIDPIRPIVVTDSGELSTWVKVADLADIVGVSMYRVTWNKYFGYFYYPLPPEYYLYKKRAIEPTTEGIFISELQAEPWPSGKSIISTSIEEQFHSMDEARILRNIDYAQRTGFNQVDLWGVEWWWYLKELHKQPAVWDTVRQVTQK